MKRQPLVSILMPAYNSESFIAESLESCINQTYKNLEVIVVDDGSSDNTLSISKAYQAEYPNIHVYEQLNSGACRARNLAFDKSSGDYIMYLDADDILSPDKVMKQIEILESSEECDAVTCPWDRFSVNIRECTFPSYHCYADYTNGLDLLVDLWNYGEMFQTSCYLVHRQTVVDTGGWIEDLKKNQDGEFFARVLMRARKVVFCPEAKVYYRSGIYESVSKGNSRSKVSSMLDSFMMYKKILNYEDSTRVREALAKNFALFRYLYNGQYPDLSSQAKEQIIELGVKHPIVGTNRIKNIAKVIGFENFLMLRKLCLKR